MTTSSSYSSRLLALLEETSAAALAVDRKRVMDLPTFAVAVVMEAIERHERQRKWEAIESQVQAKSA